MEYYDFNPQGVVFSEVPSNLFASLLEESYKAKDPYNRNLAGIIEKEYDLRHLISTPIGEELIDLCSRMVDMYSDRYEYPNLITCNSSISSYKLQSLWVNFQKKHEFNPVHNHSGVFSFVIWMKIPYDLEEELKTGAGVNSVDNVASKFQFYYSTIYGNHSADLNINKDSEGMMVMFPSTLRHAVYPFYTSDDYRISISGNICFDTDS